MRQFCINPLPCENQTMIRITNEFPICPDYIDITGFADDLLLGQAALQA